MLVTSKMLTPKQFHTFGKKMFKQRRNDLRRMSDTFKDISHEEKKTKKLARQSVRWRRSTINARRRKVRAKAKSQLGRFVGWKSSVCGGTRTPWAFVLVTCLSLRKYCCLLLRFSVTSERPYVLVSLRGLQGLGCRYRTARFHTWTFVIRRDLTK